MKEPLLRCHPRKPALINASGGRLIRGLLRQRILPNVLLIQDFTDPSGKPHMKPFIGILPVVSVSGIHLQSQIADRRNQLRRLLKMLGRNVTHYIAELIFHGLKRTVVSAESVRKCAAGHRIRQFPQNRFKRPDHRFIIIL